MSEKTVAELLREAAAALGERQEAGAETVVTNTNTKTHQIAPEGATSRGLYADVNVYKNF